MSAAAKSGPAVRGSGSSGSGAEHLFLIGDVGGTNTRLQLHSWDPATDKDVKLADKTYPSQKYSTLTDAVREFLTTFTKDRTPTSCCLALAGPVSNNRCVITNLKWDISGSALSSALSIPHVSLINDFVAAGYGCLSLPPERLHPLYTPPPGTPSPPPHPVKAIIGAGTGLGEAFAVYQPGLGAYEVLPTEGGHADFGAQTDEEWRVAADIMRRLQLRHCSVERLVSGSGIPNIYRGLRAVHPHLVQPAVDAEVLKGDAAANISRHAEKGTDELCKRSIELFVKLYGAEVGNQALRCLPVGGIYIAGGVAGKMRWAVEGPHFKAGYLNKGRLTPVVEAIPIYLAQGEVGLLGAKTVALRLLKQHSGHRGLAQIKAKL